MNNVVMYLIIYYNLNKTIKNQTAIFYRSSNVFSKRYLRVFYESKNNFNVYFANTLLNGLSTNVRLKIANPEQIFSESARTKNKYRVLLYDRICRYLYNASLLFELFYISRVSLARPSTRPATAVHCTHIQSYRIWTSISL